MKSFRSVCLFAIAVVMCKADEDFTADQCFKLFIHSKANKSDDFGGHVCDPVLAEYRDDLYRNLERSFDNIGSSENVDCIIMRSWFWEFRTWRIWEIASVRRGKAAESAVSNVSFILCVRISRVLMITITATCNRCKNLRSSRNLFKPLWRNVCERECNRNRFQSRLLHAKVHGSR